jgi:protein involved in sex pheromone biosynthesis
MQRLFVLAAMAALFVVGCGDAVDKAKEAGKDAVNKTAEAGKDAVDKTVEAGKDAVKAGKDAMTGDE